MSCIFLIPLFWYAWWRTHRERTSLVSFGAGLGVLLALCIASVGRADNEVRNWRIIGRLANADDDNPIIGTGASVTVDHDAWEYTRVRVVPRSPNYFGQTVSSNDTALLHITSDGTWTLTAVGGGSNRNGPHLRNGGTAYDDRLLDVVIFLGAVNDGSAGHEYHPYVAGSQLSWHVDDLTITSNGYTGAVSGSVASGTVVADIVIEEGWGASSPSTDPELFELLDDWHESWVAQDIFIARWMRELHDDEEPGLLDLMFVSEEIIRGDVAYLTDTVSDNLPGIKTALDHFHGDFEGFMAWVQATPESSYSSSSHEEPLKTRSNGYGTSFGDRIPSMIKESGQLKHFGPVDSANRFDTELGALRSQSIASLTLPGWSFGPVHLPDFTVTVDPAQWSTLRTVLGAIEFLGLGYGFVFAFLKAAFDVGV